MSKLKWRPRIYQVLLAVNFLLLIIPLAGLGALRVYETQIIRQTEMALISQAVYIKELYLASFRELYREESQEDKTHLGQRLTGPQMDAHRLKIGQFKEIFPTVDVRVNVKRPVLRTVEQTPTLLDDLSFKAGKNVNSILKRAQYNLLSGARIVNKDGIVVASTSEDLGWSQADREEVQRVLTGEANSIMRARRDYRRRPILFFLSFATGSYLFYSHPIVFRNHVIGGVVLSRTPRSLANFVYANRGSLYNFFTWMAIVLTIVTVLTTIFITFPIRKLIRQAQVIQTGQPTGDVLSNPGTSEVMELSNALVAMATYMEHKTNYVRDSARQMSHEFKTPIASISGAVEVLDDHGSTLSAEERKKFLDMISVSADRMQLLVDRLLELAKAEAKTLDKGKSSTDDVILMFDDLKSQYEVEFDVKSLVSADATWPMSPENMFTCLRNLVENSVRHAGVTKSIQVEFQSSPKEQSIVLTDQGAGFDLRDIEKLTEPFFTTNRENGGTGLGLSIVKALTIAAGGKLVIRNAVNGGAQVALIF